MLIHACYMNARACNASYRPATGSRVMCTYFIGAGVTPGRLVNTSLLCSSFTHSIIRDRSAAPQHARNLEISSHHVPVGGSLGAAGMHNLMHVQVRVAVAVGLEIWGQNAAAVAADV
jgi:hypothetical protein